MEREEPDDLQLLCERYYELVWRHYMFQVSCITREDYTHIQQAIPGFTSETYEEHMARVTQGIPHDVGVMIGHIRSFLAKYVEFQDSRYPETIEKMSEMMRADRERFKMEALQHLKDGSVNGEDGRPPESLSQHPPLFETYIGPAHFVLPTYCNPLMTCFYTLLFVCYAGFQQQEIDQSIPSGQFF